MLEERNELAHGNGTPINTGKSFLLPRSLEKCMRIDLKKNADFYVVYVSLAVFTPESCTKIHTNKKLCPY